MGDLSNIVKTFENAEKGKVVRGGLIEIAEYLDRQSVSLEDTRSLMLKYLDNVSTHNQLTAELRTLYNDIKNTDVAEVADIKKSISELNSNLAEVNAYNENYVHYGRCNTAFPTGCDGGRAIARITAKIADGALVLTSVDSNDPYYQLFSTNANGLYNTLDGFLEPGDKVTLSFDYIKASDVSAAVGWFAYNEEWNAGKWSETIVSIPASETSTAFSRISFNYTIPADSTGFMFRFRVYTIGGTLKIKNITLVKGDVSTSFFPEVSKYPNGVYVESESFTPDILELNIGESAAFSATAAAMGGMIGLTVTTSGIVTRLTSLVYLISCFAGTERQYIIRWSATDGYTYGRYDSVITG